MQPVFLPASLREDLREDSIFANYCDALETVTLPKSLTSIYDSFSSCDSLTSIKVEEGSSSLYSDDGVLYNYDKTTLLKYPAGRSGGQTPCRRQDRQGLLLSHGKSQTDRRTPLQKTRS